MKKLVGLVVFLGWLPAAHGDLDSLRAAAQTGDANAQLELGQLYEFGFGLKENAVPAMAWYLAASRAGNERAAQRAAALKPKLSASQQAEAERMSHEFVTAAQATTPAQSTPAPPMPGESAAPPAGSETGLAGERGDQPPPAAAPGNPQAPEPG